MTYVSISWCIFFMEMLLFYYGAENWDRCSFVKRNLLRRNKPTHRINSKLCSLDFGKCNHCLHFRVRILNRDGYLCPLD